MFYTLVLYLCTLFYFSLNIVWLLCKIISYSFPWLTFVSIFIYITSKFARLRIPEGHLFKILFNPIASNLSIANRGGTYDYPENSLAGLKEVSVNVNAIETQ